MDHSDRLDIISDLKKIRQRAYSLGLTGMALEIEAVIKRIQDSSGAESRADILDILARFLIPLLQLFSNRS